MQEQLICRHVPIRGYLVRQPDGSYKLDPVRSTYADIPADDIVQFLVERLAPGTITKGGGQMNKFLISGYLGAGIENALLLRELEALTGMNPREIRRQIQRERRTGVPILSDNLHGYYLAADDWEVTQFVRSMRKRAREILKVAQAVENPALVPDILSSKTTELPTENVTGKEVK